MKLKFLIVFLGFAIASYARAYEQSAESIITQITAQATDHRFVINGGTLCGTNVFTIRTTSSTGKEQFALVLAAAASGKKVVLEIWAACPSTNPSQNWGMFADNIAITAKFN